ncbi:MAG TPA: hypothetical protein VFI11_13100 [Anaerolineales bacterium]|nr:hypothetical protein [Anaerolineales bacterium]
MRKASRTIGTIAFLLLLVLIGWWVVGRGRQPMISAAALTPAPTPADNRQIASLTFSITSNGAGEVIGVTMVEGAILPGYAPNVLHRPGAWTVVLASPTQEVLRFGIPDPRLVRVEGGAGDVPHTSTFLLEVEFDVTLPLADPQGNDLGVTAIGLLDETGRLIFVASLREGEIVPFPPREFFGPALIQ